MEKEQPTEFIIPAPLAQGVINYLQAKPYAEVYQLIAAMVQLKPIQDEANGDDSQAG